MATFIYRLRLTAPFRNKKNWTDETQEILSRHFNHLKKNCEDGKVLLVGRTDLDVSDPMNFGIVIFSASSLEDAQKFGDSDPTVKENIMTAEVFPFSLALMSERKSD